MQVDQSTYLTPPSHRKNAMVLFTAITKKLNRALAPRILKHSLSLRYALSPNKPIVVDNPYIDSLLLLPLTQKLLSIEVQHVAKERVQDIKRREEEEGKKSAVDDFVDRVWDKYLEPISPSPIQTGGDGDVVDGMTNETDKNYPPRLKAFIEYMRPVLVPNETFHEVNRWRFNNHFVKWLRSQYLICKYEDEIRDILSKHPKLKQCSLLRMAKSKLRDTVRYGISSSLILSMMVDNDDDDDKHHHDIVRYAKTLPPINVVNEAFQMGNWTKTKSTVDEYEAMRKITHMLGGAIVKVEGTNIHIPDIDETKTVNLLSLEQILEVAGCHVSSCNAFNALCESADIYEFWTQEYVHELSNYLLERSKVLSAKDGKDIVIIDVGAGDGILAHFLKENIVTKRVSRGKKNLTKKSNKNSLAGLSSKHNEGSIPTIVATDDGSWNILPKANVEKLSVKEAMNKYGSYDESTNSKQHHLIVICSWMPMNLDWTKEFRDAGVDEYILIGECDDGNCGDNWRTWGNKEFFVADEEDVDVDINSLIPDYRLDGFQRHELDRLTKLQFSRFDSMVSSGSKTISFRRGD